MTDILAIVSKAIFERDSDALELGEIWETDRYVSTNKALQPLASGGRIFLVTVRPPSEQLWLVGVLEQPAFDGTAWVARAPNRVPATNISALRRSITFVSGKGISQDKGTLGMSLQMPRALTAGDVAQLLAAIDGVVPAAAPAPAAPARVIDGRYEIIRELGKGGMGVVYEARHTGTGRHVAVKEIVGDLDATLLERFQREVRATRTIETRHIAPVLDTGHDDHTKHPYLVMELLHGSDLQEILGRAGSVPEHVALRIAAQACVGLARAHAAGVVHRDIKPANLFLARRDHELVVTLLDFGVARVKEQMNGVTSMTLTSTGIMLGTPLYMSPEQVVGAKDLDHRTDLWALGVVLYEALTGATPHEDAETIGALLVAICSKPARSVRDFSPDISPAAAAIVARALELSPASRYPSAEAMLADLREALPEGTALDDTMLHPPALRAFDPLAFAETTPR